MIIKSNLLVPTELVEKAVQGDEEAISEIYKECNEPVRRFVRKKLMKRSFEKDPLPEDVEDAVSETFSRMVKSLPELENPQAFTKWIFVIAESVCKRSDEHTKKDDKYMVDLNMSASDECADKSDFEPSLENFPDETIVAPDDYTVNTELWETVALLIESLPEKQKNVIEQFYFKQKSLEEIADTTGENLSSVKSQKRYGIRKLQKELKKFGYGGNFVVVPVIEFFRPMKDEVKIGGRGVGVTVSTHFAGTAVPIAALFTVSVVGLSVFAGLKDDGPNLRGDVRVNSGTDSRPAITTSSLSTDTQLDNINITTQRTGSEPSRDTDASADEAPASAAVPTQTTAEPVNNNYEPDSPDVTPDYEPNTQPDNEPASDSSLPDNGWVSVPYHSGINTDFNGMTSAEFYDIITEADYGFMYQVFHSDDLLPNYLELSDVSINTLNNVKIEFTYNLKSLDPEDLDLYLTPGVRGWNEPEPTSIEYNKKVIDENKITYYFHIPDDDLLINNENGSSFLDTYGYFLNFINPEDLESEYWQIYDIDDEGIYSYTAPDDIVEKTIEPFYQEDGVLSLSKDMKSITLRFQENVFGNTVYTVGESVKTANNIDKRDFYNSLPNIFEKYNIKDIEIDKENPYFKKIGNKLYYHDADTNEDYFIIELSGV